MEKQRIIQQFENIGNNIASLCSYFESLKNVLTEYVETRMENMFELGRNAEHFAKKHGLDYEDSKEVYLFCKQVSEEFEQQYDPDQEDYYQALYEFSEKRTLEEYGRKEEDAPRPQPMKDSAIFVQTLHQICYIPENAESDKDKYSRSRILALVHGDHSLCRQLFDTLDWQFPETLIDENLRDGLWGECEACGRYYCIEDEEMTECPICHTPITKGE